MEHLKDDQGDDAPGLRRPVDLPALVPVETRLREDGVRVVQVLVDQGVDQDRILEFNFKTPHFI